MRRKQPRPPGRLSPDGCPLSDEQFTMVALMCDGLTAFEISEARQVSPSTVSRCLASVYIILRASDRTDARDVMLASGWLDASSTVRAHRPWRSYSRPIPPVTGAQRSYLDAFDRSLRAGRRLDDLDRDCARGIRAMRHDAECRR